MTDFLEDSTPLFLTSNLQAIDDVGLDEEEREKIRFEVSQSRGPKSLKVDWSDLSEHVVFGSGYWTINFALSRIHSEDTGYPWDGELKDKNNWRLSNTDFENWWFDNEYPHEFGHAYFPSGSGQNSSVIFQDYENKVKLTASFTIEFALKSHEDFDDRKPLFSNIDSNENGVMSYLKKEGSEKYIVISRLSASSENALSTSFDNYISSSHRVSFAYSVDNDYAEIFIDGDLKVSSSAFSIGEISAFAQEFRVACIASASAHYYYSGSIDDVRVYSSRRGGKLVERNWFKDTHANSSASMKLYYKFSEVNSISTNQVIDYSGMSNHGTFSGSFTSSVNRVSGTLGSWYKTSGDPIFNRSNIRVSASLAKWFTSGSLHDQTNESFIFNLVPSQFIEESGNEDMQLFLLLLGRHYDKLRLYIKHLAYTTYSNESGKNIAPDELLNVVAENYGLDIAGVYESSDPLEYFFGESVFTGSTISPLQKIRNELRRNLVNNLTYVLKTKSTREAIDASIRALGIDSEAINVNEYSRLSGGIETTKSEKDVERRVLRLSGATSLYLHSSSFDTGPTTWEFNFLLNSASLETTSSLFTIFSGSDKVVEIRSERANPTSSQGRIVYDYPGASASPLATITASIYDNEWVKVVAWKPESGGTFGVHAGRVFRDSVDFHISASGDATGGENNHPTTWPSFTASFGTSGPQAFDGWLMQARVWHGYISSSAIIENHIEDFESLSVEDPTSDISNLKISHVLNDFTSSASGDVPIHNHAFDGAYSGSLVGASSSAQYNFPGKYITRLIPSYSYDIGINNSKIRIRSGSAELSNQDIVEDIPYVSVDISPIPSLNKEIVKWFGDLEKFNNIVGQPWKRYNTEISELNPYRSEFFEKRLGSKVDFSAYLNLIKWFDSNFAYFLRQLIPLDVNSSLSSFVVEPHLFEYNKIEHPFPFRNGVGQSRNVIGSASVSPVMTASNGIILGFADPGRFGTPVSSSGDTSVSFSYADSSSSGVTFKDREQRKFYFNTLRDNVGNEYGPKGYMNGFYNKTITGSKHLQNSLGVIENFNISKIPYRDSGITNTSLLSSSQGPATNDFFTSSASLNFIQDQRWLYYQRVEYSQNDNIYDLGIQFGGGIGQLFYVFGKSTAVSETFSDAQGREWAIGTSTSINRPKFDEIVQIFEKGERSETFVLWPEVSDYDGVKIYNFAKASSLDPEGTKSAERFGDRVYIEGYKHIDINIRNQFLEGGLDASGGGTTINTLLIDLKFQFFDEDYPGLGTETVMSTSVDANNNLINEQRDRVYRFIKTWRRDDLKPGEGWSHRISRNIPNAKYMRVNMRYTLLNNDQQGVVVRTSVKGTLTRDERASVGEGFSKVDL